MRNLTTGGEVNIFKTVAVSRFMHYMLVMNVPMTVIKEFNKKEK